MKILLHEAQKHSEKNQRTPFPWFGKQLNGHTTGGESTHAGLAPSNSFILPAISYEILGSELGRRLLGVSSAERRWVLSRLRMRATQRPVRVISTCSCTAVPQPVERKKVFF